MQKDEFQEALDILIDLEIACRENHLASEWWEQRVNKAHKLIFDKSNYPELRRIIIEIEAALSRLIR